jgi:hypothetical protein
MENKGLLAVPVAIALVALSVLAFNSLTSPSVIVTGGGSQGVAEQRYGGTTNLDSLGLSGTLSVTGRVTAGALTVGSAGTASDLMVRTTLTVDPASIAASAATSSDVTLTGAGTSDHCYVSGLSGDLTGSTSTAVLSCVVTASNVATVYYRNVSSTAAYNAGSSVLSIKADSF